MRFTRRLLDTSLGGWSEFDYYAWPAYHVAR